MLKMQKQKKYTKPKIICVFCHYDQISLIKNRADNRTFIPTFIRPI